MYLSLRVIFEFRKVVLLVLLALGTTHSGSYGQKLRFTDTANKWQASHWHFGDDGFSSLKLQYAYKDTNVAVHGVSYRMLVSNLVNPPRTVALIREDSQARKVYIRKWGNYDNYIGNGVRIKDTGDVLLYNYNLSQGDTMMLPLSYSGSDTFRSMHILAQKDSVPINGVMHIVQYFYCQFGYDYPLERYTVIEGIGSLTDPVTPGPVNNFEVTSTLNCFRNGDSISPISISNGWYLFENSCPSIAVRDIALLQENWSLSPNPAADLVTIRFSRRPETAIKIAVRDVLGKIMYSGVISAQLHLIVGHWPEGLYFIALSDTDGRQSLKRLVLRR